MATKKVVALFIHYDKNKNSCEKAVQYDLYLFSFLTAESLYRIDGNPVHEYICADNTADDLFHDCLCGWGFDNDFIAAFVELLLK